MQGSHAWLLNQNLFPLEKVFISCEITATPEKEASNIQVRINEDNISADIEVSRTMLSQKIPESKKRNHLENNLAKIGMNSTGEIFVYLNENLRKKNRYFYCGNDMFYLNDFGSFGASENAIGKNSEKMKKNAMEWLLEEDVLKTELANPYTFTAEVLKKYIWSNEQQTIFICGEKESGKTSNLLQVLDMLCYYNVSTFEGDSVESLRNRKVSRKERVSKLEKILLTDGAEEVARASNLLQGFKSEKRETEVSVSVSVPIQSEMVSRQSQMSRKPSEVSRKTNEVSKKPSEKVRKNTELLKKQSEVSRKQTETMDRDPKVGVKTVQKPSRQDVYRLFNKELASAHLLLNSFIQVYEGNNRFSNGASLKILLSADEWSKFVGFSFSVNMLQSFRLLSKVS